jgi:hypothetical protein
MNRYNRDLVCMIFVLVVAILCALLSGCATCQPDCTGMDSAECADLKRDCEAIEKMGNKDPAPIPCDADNCGKKPIPLLRYPSSDSERLNKMVAPLKVAEPV